MCLCGGGDGGDGQNVDSEKRESEKTKGEFSLDVCELLIKDFNTGYCGAATFVEQLLCQK